LLCKQAYPKGFYENYITPKNKLNVSSDSNNIAVSAKGIDLPYRRFLSDTAGGILFVLVTLLFIALTFDVPTAKGESSFLESFSILIGAFLFLIATPIGVTLNALSWFLLGNCVYQRVNKIADREEGIWTFTRGSKQAYNFEKSLSFFGITKEEFLNKYFELGSIVKQKYPDIKGYDDVSGGTRRFLRSTILVIWYSAFLFIVFVLYNSSFHNFLFFEKTIKSIAERSGFIDLKLAVYMILVVNLISILFFTLSSIFFSFFFYRIAALTKFYELTMFYDFLRVKILSEDENNGKLNKDYDAIRNYLMPATTYIPNDNQEDEKEDVAEPRGQ